MGYEEDLELFRKMRNEIGSRKTAFGVNDFWFNGKLWSQMSEAEKEETRNIFLRTKPSVERTEGE